MADSEKQVSYGLKADASPFEAGLQRGSDAARGFATNIDGQFRKVGDAFAAVQKQLVVLAGLVAGGAFFKDAISASNELTGETMKLVKALGITSEEADTLRTALADIGSDSDTYVEAFQKFARQLKTNEAGLQAMGLQTRDANGNLRDSNELYTEAIQLVGEYRPGLDQTTAAMTLFGKSVDQVIKLQKLDKDVKEEARRKNEELGLSLTKDGVAASKAYRLAMNDVSDVLTAVKKVIGDAVMPIFTELGQYFASTGPYVVEIFKGAMMALLATFEVVRAAVKTVSAIVFEAFTLIVEGAGMLGDVFSKLFKGDFSGAYESAKALGTRVGQAFSGAFASFIDAGNEIPEAIDAHARRLYGSGGGHLEAPQSKGNKDRRMGGFRDSKDTARVSTWDAELAEQKLAYQEAQNTAGTFYQFSKAQELAFWKDKLAITSAGTAENTAVRKKVAELQLGISQDAFQHELASLQTQEAAYKQNMDAKLALLDREAALVKQRYGAESKEYEEVQKKIVEAKREAIEQQKQMDVIRAQSARDAQLSQLALEEQHAQLQVELGEMTQQQLIAKEQEFEQRRFEIALQGLKERQSILAADPDRNSVALEQIHAAIEEAERQHQQRLGQIRNQAVLQATAASRSIADAMTNGMQQGLSRMMQGQINFRNFMQSVWQSLRGAVADVLAKMVIDFIKNSVAMAAVKRLLTVFDIGANAAQAGAGAAASAADTPVIGWLLAPAAAAATFAMASGFASNVPSFSAAGGFDIPGTVNPLVQAHASEMILPAKYADVIRGMADGQQQSGDAASRSEIHVHNHIHAVDSKDARRFLLDNNDHVAEAVRRALRNFK